MIQNLDVFSIERLHAREGLKGILDRLLLDLLHHGDYTVDVLVQLSVELFVEGYILVFRGNRRETLLHMISCMVLSFLDLCYFIKAIYC